MAPLELGIEVPEQQRNGRWALIGVAAVSGLMGVAVWHSATSTHATGTAVVQFRGTDDRHPGGDRDAHGCTPSAGYSWCVKTSECIRPREHGLTTPEAFQHHCGLARSGGDADEHGCIPSAGYSWCAQMAQCIRPWEHGFNSTEAFQAHCAVNEQNDGELSEFGSDRDAHGCIPSAGYSWCAKTSECIRPREHGLATPEAFQQHCGLARSGGDADEHGCIASAGYSWCAQMTQCIRPWEHGFNTTEALQAHCTVNGQDAVELPTADHDVGPRFGGVNGGGILAKQFTCSCPPSEALWSCSEEAYQALMNGTACEFYRTGVRADCPACNGRGAEVSLPCRACANGKTVAEFCAECAKLGLNDAGCKNCG